MRKHSAGSPDVVAHDIRKVVIIGPECSGKTTLATALALALAAPLAEEFAREYLNKSDRAYNQDDLYKIAVGQIAAEEAAAARAVSGLFICDTDLYVIKVWSEVKYGYCHRHILEEIAERRCHLYLLTDTDVPYREDPLREHPAAADRLRLYREYQDIVSNSGVPFAVVSGSEEERLAQALDSVTRMQQPAAQAL